MQTDPPTEAEIQRQLEAHAQRIAKAERENWFMKPIPLIEKEWQLHWQTFSQEVEESNTRIREYYQNRRRKTA